MLCELQHEILLYWLLLPSYCRTAQATAVVRATTAVRATSPAQAIAAVRVRKGKTSGQLGPFQLNHFALRYTLRVIPKTTGRDTHNSRSTGMCYRTQELLLSCCTLLVYHAHCIHYPKSGDNDLHGALYEANEAETSTNRAARFGWIPHRKKIRHSRIWLPVPGTTTGTAAAVYLGH